MSASSAWREADRSKHAYWKRCLSLAVLAPIIAGCGSPPPPGERISFASAVGTPFYVAFKIPTCVATLALAGPAAAVQGLAAPNEDKLQPDIRPDLDAGIADNCGPPYVLPPD